MFSLGEVLSTDFDRSLDFNITLINLIEDWTSAHVFRSGWANDNNRI